MAEIKRSVGKSPAPNDRADQEIVRTLLNKIPEWVFGAEGLLEAPIVDGRISEELQTAIDRFQSFQVYPDLQDGRVDPGGTTYRQMKDLASRTWLPNYRVSVPLYGQRSLGLPAGVVADNACWWACIRMLLDANGASAVGAPVELLQARKALNNMDLVPIYRRYHIVPVSGYKTDWTAAQLAKALQQNGPLCATGRFAVGDTSTLDIGAQHAVVVYGINERAIVMINDPWQPSERLLVLPEFNARLHYGGDAILAATKNMRLHSVATLPRQQASP